MRATLPQTKKAIRERERLVSDLTAAQHAFTSFLTPDEKSAIVAGLHSDAIQKVADEAQWSWSYGLERLEGDLESAKKACAKFAAEFAADPARAARWADSPIWSAAQVAVLDEFIPALRTHGPAKVQEHFTRSLLNRASSPHHSTSRTASLYEEFYTAAIARALETVRWWA